MDYEHKMNTATFETNCTMIKDMVIAQLFQEGKISEEVYDEYKTHYSVIIKAPSKFNWIWDKLTSQPDEPRFIIVKNVSMVNLATDDDKTTSPKKVLQLFKCPTTPA